MAGFDYDWIVVGSGFGGSVSALRLAEKGYRVAVLECGRRFEDDDFARSTWNWRRFLWMPRLGLRGILEASTTPARFPPVRTVHEPPDSPVPAPGTASG